MSPSTAVTTGGGRHHAMPLWVKAAIYVLLVLVAVVLTWEMGLFLILVSTGGLTIWAWTREKGNIVDSARDFAFCLALLATSMAGPMNLAATGFRGIGPAVWDAGWGRVEQWRGTTSPAPAPPPAPGPAAPPPVPAMAPVR